MSVKINEFIEPISFEYFETYSFQRNGNYEVYETLLEKYKENEQLLTVQEHDTFKRLRKLNLYAHSNFIFEKDGVLNKSAELMHDSFGTPKAKDELIENFKQPFVDFDAWQCAPIYRDAILFYDKSKILIDGINICFGCSHITSLTNKEIIADKSVYQKLKEFLKSFGHKIK